MKYNSLRQYFYKLYAISFVLALLPLCAFIFLYQGFRLSLLKTIELDIPVDFLTYATMGISGAILLIMWVVFAFNVSRIRRQYSLGEKLSSYGTLTIVRTVGFVIAMLVMAGGFYLTESKWITIFFIVSLLLPAWLWPFPLRVCKDLQLKGDERMMVHYKMDSF